MLADLARAWIKRVIIVAFLLVIAVAINFVPKPGEGRPGSWGAAAVKILVGDGHGSGVHIGNGLIITAWHVTQIAKPKIKTTSGTELDAETLWSNRKYDVALVRANDGLAGNLAIAQLSCTTPPVGAPIEIIGNPGDSENVRTLGYVASGAMAKDVDRPDYPEWHEIILGDVTIAPGNSGGPVFDGSGRIVGIAVGVNNRAPLALIVPGRVICMLLAR